jgi:hypothetical protein
MLGLQQPSSIRIAPSHPSPAGADYRHVLQSGAGTKNWPQIEKANNPKNPA